MTATATLAFILLAATPAPTTDTGDAKPTLVDEIVELTGAEPYC